MPHPPLVDVVVTLYGVLGHDNCDVAHRHISRPPFSDAVEFYLAATSASCDVVHCCANWPSDGHPCSCWNLQA
jgi:hypothetical protein